VRRLFALWFGLAERVDRKTYPGHGTFLTLDYAAGRDDARDLLRELEAGQLELLD
jgi:hypothetical protein